MNLRRKPQAILVTGGAGFIGSNFLHRMVPRYADIRFVNLDKLTYAGNLMNLRALQRESNYRFVRGDIADGDLLKRLFAKYRFATIVHFAAESHVDRSIRAPVAFAQSNVVGTVTLLEAARQAWEEGLADNGHYLFLHVSTDEVFGSAAEGAYFTETTPYAPRSPYSASKASSDQFVRAYGATYNLPFIISNCSNNYGPYQYPEKLIPLVILRALEEKPVPVYGTGANVRDWLYVADHCAAIDLMLQRGEPFSTYLVGGSSDRANLEVVTLVLDIVDETLGRKPQSSRALITFVEDRPGHDFRYAIDARHIRASLGWRPEHTLREGLRETVAWYLRNRDWLDSTADKSYRRYFREQYDQA